jgi:glycosyltransferase involved in cell wall biosynthesis
LEDVAQLAAGRDQDVIKLLFIGVDWFRKGGAKAVAIAQDIREKGYKVELTVVGCIPPEAGPLPESVKVLGFISKATIEGRMLLAQLFSESHFFLLPTTAETFGMVFAEASAFGVPSFSHRIGGVPSVVIEGANGFLFDVDQPISDWSESIISLFADKARMHSLAMSCFNEYTRRLNWNVVSKEAIALIEQTITS